MAFLSNRLSQRLFRQTPFLPCLCRWAKGYAERRYVPSIKFRYSGGAKTAKNLADASKKGKSKALPSKGATKRSKTAAIEDWEIPKRYQRKRMSQTEMDYINAGGPP